MSGGAAQARAGQLMVLTAASHPSYLAELAGAKGINLHRLGVAGLNVPRWAVIGTDVLCQFRQDNGFNDAIDEALDRLTAENVDEIASEIQETLAGGELDETIVGLIADAYAHVGVDEVAVRSSCADEDGHSASFAGQYLTLLNTQGLETVIQGVRACWASAYSLRSLRYRLLRGLPVDRIEMAVVIQAMVFAEKSGVMFTVNSVSSRADEILISAAFGLGEGIVDGVVDADSVVVDRGSGIVKEVTIGEKDERLEPAVGGGVTSMPLGDDARAARSISDQEIEELCGCARQVEQIFGYPQDVEWAITSGELFVLQSRPITTRVDAPPGEERIWDNSNIMESYGEITAPLTFSFASWVYHRVFRDHAKLIGVPRLERRRLEAWLPNMLGYFNGRVYYNLLNWYRLVGLLPFYGAHRRTLEVSLGVSESIDDRHAVELRPLQRKNRLVERMVRARIALRFAWHFATIEVSVARFLRHCNRLYGEFEPVDYSSLSAEAVFDAFGKAEQELLSRWGRMVVLEAVLALSFGAMHALTSRWLPEAPSSLVWEMAKIDTDVESTQPVERLRELAEIVRADAELTAIVEALSPGDEYRELQRAEGAQVTAFRSQIERYLRDFGYRNANELKLEEPDLCEDPTLLFGMLKDAMSQLDLNNEWVKRVAAGESGEDYLKAYLRGPRLWIYKLVRRRVRRALRARESIRFWRTRTFGIARRMFRAIGEDMARFGAVESARDVFYLRLEELRGAFNGTIAHRELKPIIELRKRLEDEYRSLQAPARFNTSGAIYWGGLEKEWSSPTDVAGNWDGRELRGVPCGPGVAEGEASVVDRPVDAAGRVLVTYRTDPGWIGALASASGLVIERGSPLTHVAVVARELGIPTVIQVPRVTERVRSGDCVRVDGGAGTVTVQAHEEPGSPS